MKKLLFTLLTTLSFLIPTAELLAQCTPAHPLAQPTCELAIENILASPFDLITTTCFDIAANPNPPSPITVSNCSFGDITFESPYFWAFEGGITNDFTISILWENGQAGQGTNEGIKWAIFEYDQNNCIGNVLYCDNLCEFPSEAITFYLNEIEPCKKYILVLDVCEGSTAIGQFEVTGDYEPASSNGITPLLTCEANCDDIQVGNVISLTADEAGTADSYTFEITSPDGQVETITSPSNIIEYPIIQCGLHVINLTQIVALCDTFYPNLTFTFETSPYQDPLIAVSSTEINSGEEVVLTFSNIPEGHNIKVTNGFNASLTGYFPISLSSNPASVTYTLENSSDQPQPLIIFYQIAGPHPTCESELYSIEVIVNPKNTIIGGTIWEEIREDCKLGQGEIGIPNIPVELMSNSNIVTSARTNTMGHYSFDDVADGDYYIRIPKSAFVGETICPKYQDANNDIDNDHNGYENGDYYRTTVFTIANGTEPQGGGTSNTTFDMGFVLNCNKINLPSEDMPIQRPIYDLRSVAACRPLLMPSPIVPRTICQNFDNGQQHPIGWQSFYAGKGGYSVNVKFDNCADSAAQVAVFGGDDIVFCETIDLSNANEIEIPSNLLTPTELYTFYVMTAVNESCIYYIEVAGYYEPLDFYKVTDIINQNGRDTICWSDDILVLEAQNEVLSITQDDVDTTWWTVSIDGVSDHIISTNHIVYITTPPTNNPKFVTVILDSIRFINGCVFAPALEKNYYQSGAEEDFGTVQVCDNLLATYRGPQSVDNAGLVTDPNGDGVSGWLYELPLQEGINNQRVNVNGCEVYQTVNIVLLQSPTINIAQEDEIITIGETITVNTNENGIFNSANPSILAVTNTGLATGISVGMATITQTTPNGCSSNMIKITVVANDSLPTLIDRRLCVGDMEQIINYEDFFFVSSDTAIVRITAEGVVEALSEGIVSINVIDETGVPIDSWTVTVNANPVITILGPDTIFVGETTLLGPQGGLVWNTSNPNVASINNAGILTGLAPGIVNASTINLSTGCTATSSPIVVLPQVVIDEYILCGTVYMDDNANGIRDMGEQGLSGFRVRDFTSNVVYFTDAQGFYQFTVDEGQRILQYESTYGIWQENAISNNLSITDEKTTVNVGFVPEDSSMTFDIVATAGVLRCNTFANLNFSVLNEGNFITSGSMKVVLDPTIAYTQFDPAPSSINANEYTWQFSNLSPGSSFKPYIRIGVPPFFPSQDSLRFAIEVYDAEGDLSATKQYIDFIRCSYDPNDKRVFPDRPGDENLILAGEELEYIIRFQNNGNDTAFYVEVQDVISPLLDINTLTIKESSHDVSVQIHEDTVFFIFNPIALVDSTTDYEGSQGFVSIAVIAQSDIALGEVISNTASIIFDRNDPIITNTVVNTVTDILPCYDLDLRLSIQDGLLLADPNAVFYIWIDCNTGDTLQASNMPSYDPEVSGTYQAILVGEACQSKTQCVQVTIVGTEEVDIWDLQIAPNPTRGLIILNTSEAIHSVKVYNMDGKRIMETNETDEIDLSILAPGMYIIEAHSKEGIRRGSVVKQ